LKKAGASASMIAQHAPVLEPGDRVFDARSAAPMRPPRTVTHDATPSEARCRELRDTAISAVGQHPTMALAEVFDF
jgi:hypothetical protein